MECKFTTLLERPQANEAYLFGGDDHVWVEKSVYSVRTSDTESSSSTPPLRSSPQTINPHSIPLPRKGPLAFSSSPPIKIAIPPGTTAVYASSVSLDTQFSSTKISWNIEGHDYALDFVRIEGAHEILTYATIGLPIATITKDIPDKINLLCTVTEPESPWRFEAGTGPIVLGPDIVRTGLNGEAQVVQVKFRRWTSDFSGLPQFTVVTLQFQFPKPVDYDLFSSMTRRLSIASETENFEQQGRMRG